MKNLSISKIEDLLFELEHAGKISNRYRRRLQMLVYQYRPKVKDANELLECKFPKPTWRSGIESLKSALKEEPKIINLYN